MESIHEKAKSVRIFIIVNLVKKGLPTDLVEYLITLMIGKIFLMGCGIMQSTILSVLVVDDEEPIREELKMFDWEANGAILMGTASNGYEALDFCRDYTPDVVITDITMPKMDGIELSRKLKQEFPQIQIIVLTAYSEFQFAKEAIKIGALDYLVKVMVEDEAITNALDKARKVIIRENIYLKNSRTQLRWDLSEVLTELMKADTNKSDQVFLELESVGVFVEFPYHISKLCINATMEDLLFIDRIIQSSLSSLENNKDQPFMWIPIKAGEYCIFFKDQTRNHKELKRRLEGIIPKLEKELVEQLFYISSEINVYGLISRSITNKKELFSELKSINQRNNYGFYDNLAKISLIEDISFQSLNEELVKEIEEKMNESWPSIPYLQPFLHDVFYQWCSNNEIHPDEVKGLLVKWRMEWLKQIGVENKEIDKNQLILRATTLSRAITLLIDELSQKVSSNDRYRIEIINAIKIVKREIAKPISLSFIAEKVGLSANYLSRLFREETGKSFNEFVTNYRIDMAIKLLQTTNLKVYEVAEQVGIPSYRYFSVLFRKSTGLTPKEFRKR